VKTSSDSFQDGFECAAPRSARVEGQRERPRDAGVKRGRFARSTAGEAAPTGEFTDSGRVALEARCSRVRPDGPYTSEGVGSLECPADSSVGLLMTLTLLTMVAGTALGGGLEVGVPAVVLAAAVALAVLAAANGARLMRRVAELFDE
jgi:hypothetical protein